MGHLRWRFYTTSVFVHQFANRNRYRLNHSQNASKIEELKVTDDIVDDIKDSIECHLDWFST